MTVDGTVGKVTAGSAVVDGVNNTITTGGANAVKLDGAAGTVKTGAVTVTGGTTNDITGLSNTTVNSADFATKRPCRYGRTIETGRGTNMANHGRQRCRYVWCPNRY